MTSRLKFSPKKYAAAFCGLLVLCGCATKADPIVRGDGIVLTNVRAVVATIQHAKNVRLSAWVLSDRGELSRALRHAAERGAKVRLVLDGVPAHNIAATNRKTARRLRAEGVDVSLSPAALHAKLALVDGVAYLTDRNWTTRSRAEIVVRDDEGDDARIVAAAMDGRPESNARLSTRKADALLLEAGLIRATPGANIGVETEAFTGGGVVDAALVAQAAQGAKIRLIVDRREYSKSARERATLVALAHRGIAVRTGRSGEKLAIVNDRAWVGSANATPGSPEQIDWGMLMPPQTTAAVARAFERNWRSARPIADKDAAGARGDNVNTAPVAPNNA